MKHFLNILRVLPMVALSVTVTGCLGLKPKPDPSRYYVIGSGVQNAAAQGGDCEERVILGPVVLAGHLDNPKIARRSGENEIVYYDWTFWAEPLPRALPRELLSSLEKVIPEACVFSYRRATPDDESIQLAVTIEQFEMTDNGNAIVSATWDVSSDAWETRRRGSARISRPYDAGADEIVSGVQALTAALADLSKKMAGDLR